LDIVGPEQLNCST